MSLDIKISEVEQKRHAYANIAKRHGSDRVASRYEEATFDMQSTVNFHYRPTWDPQRELYDESRTAIVMKDWYAFHDPRQFYYGTYTIARNKMMDVCDTNFKFVEKKNLIAAISPEWLEMIQRYLLPLRHYEWGANTNNINVAHLGWGAAVTQCATFAALDRLGIAQVISRIGLLIDGHSGEALAQTRDDWVDNPMWQGLRHAMEDSFVLSDWFEQLLVQNTLFDGLLYLLVYQEIDKVGVGEGATAVSILCEFMDDWHRDHVRWNDALLKTVVSESADNKKQLGQWVDHWLPRAVDALRPVADYTLGSRADAVLYEVFNVVAKRLVSAGLESPGFDTGRAT